MKDFYLEQQNGVVTLKCRALDAVPGVRHGFSTRHGGVSEGYLASMNFSYHKEAEAVVDENFRRFAAANGLPFESLVLTDQVHKTHVQVVDGTFRHNGRCRNLQETDGLVTTATGLGLVCFTADCVPILMADPVSGAVAAVHAGWRGTVARIAAAAVEKMVAQGAEPQNIIAAIGPSIGPCHFEVSPEVQQAFNEAFGKKLPIVPSVREGHTMVDLWQANKLALLESGLKEENVHLAAVCTFCNHRDYYSHRYTQGRRGLMIGAIAREEL